MDLSLLCEKIVGKVEVKRTLQFLSMRKKTTTSRKNLTLKSLSKGNEPEELQKRCNNGVDNMVVKKKLKDVPLAEGILKIPEGIEITLVPAKPVRQHKVRKDPYEGMKKTRIPMPFKSVLIPTPSNLEKESDLIDPLEFTGTPPAKTNDNSDSCALTPVMIKSCNENSLSASSDMGDSDGGSTIEPKGSVFSSDGISHGDGSNKQLSANKHGSRVVTKKNSRRPPYCKICLKVFLSFRKLKAHRKEHEGINPYKCSSCTDVFPVLEELTAHVRIHQGKLPYKCKKCENAFETLKELKTHERIHILVRKPIPAIKKIHSCEVCLKNFAKVCDLERHLRVHTGEKPAVCNICNKRFQQVHNLNKHLLTHIDSKPFECDICGKKFGRCDVLNRHSFTHSLVKPYYCGPCDKSFIRISQLKAHNLKYHVEHTVQDIITEVNPDIHVEGLINDNSQSA